MNPIFANSSIGTDFANAPTNAARQGLGCATTAQLTACRFVRTDCVAYIVHSGLKFGLAHVRVDTQVGDLDKLKTHVGGSMDVYLIGGFAPQPGPARRVLSKYSGLFSLGTAKGISTVYGHVQKAHPMTAGRTDATGHVPGFVAHVGPNAYSIGTHSLFGCVAVLGVPANTTVNILKVHIYDATHTLPGIGAAGTTTLTTQVF